MENRIKEQNCHYKVVKKLIGAEKVFTKCLSSSSAEKIKQIKVNQFVFSRFVHFYFKQLEFVSENGLSQRIHLCTPEKLRQ